MDGAPLKNQTGARHILSGKRKAPPNMGEQTKVLLTAWEQHSLRMATHVEFGWPDEAPIKFARMPLKDTIVEVKD